MGIATQTAATVGEVRRNPYVGMWSFALHRITGVVLALYMIPHILVIGGLGDPGGMTQRVRAVSNPIAEALLLAAIAFHSTNGIRLVLADFGAVSRVHKGLLAALMVLAAAIVVVGGGKLLHVF
jgi:succinate dehydrogenase / fumarate reductase, cytochrome b subunit